MALERGQLRLMDRAQQRRFRNRVRRNRLRQRQPLLRNRLRRQRLRHSHRVQQQLELKRERGRSISSSSLRRVSLKSFTVIGLG